MVCDKCAKKLSKVVVQDTWRDGARNLTTTEKKDETGGRGINENMLLSKYGKDKKFMPNSRKCILCKGQIHQWAHYCSECAYKKGICARCGIKIVNTSDYKMSTR